MTSAERSGCPEPCADPPSSGPVHKMAAGRRRLLPAWMAAAEQPAAPAGPHPTAARRRRRQRQGQVVARAATIYCMTEAELVDVALGVLAEKLQREEAQEKTWSASEEEQDNPTPSSPATSVASMEEHSDGNPSQPSPPHTGAEKPGGQDSEDDDVLKYVREIFFS